MTGNICFIDFETTGIDVFRDEPIEIGAILVDPNLTILDKFYSRIKIQKKIYLKKSAFKIHNIALAELADAPTQKDVLINFFERLGTDYRLAGWNISFDVTFFRKLCNKNAFMTQFNKINHRHLDIQTMNFIANQLRLYSDSCNSLSEVASRFGLSRNNSHNALEDANLTLEVYKNLYSLFKGELKLI